MVTRVQRATVSHPLKALGGAQAGRCRAIKRVRPVQAQALRCVTHIDGVDAADASCLINIYKPSVCEKVHVSIVTCLQLFGGGAVNLLERSNWIDKRKASRCVRDVGGRTLRGRQVDHLKW